MSLIESKANGIQNKEASVDKLSLQKHIYDTMVHFEKEVRKKATFDINMKKYELSYPQDHNDLLSPRVWITRSFRNSIKQTDFFSTDNLALSVLIGTPKAITGSGSSMLQMLSFNLDSHTFTWRYTPVEWFNIEEFEKVFPPEAYYGQLELNDVNNNVSVDQLRLISFGLAEVKQNVFPE